MRRLLPLVLLLAGCGDPETALRVGAKDFAEQKVLAEMLASVLRAHDLSVEDVVDCTDTYGCQRMLREGRIDLMVDYTGTGLSFIGAPAGEQSIERVRTLYAPLDLAWLDPLGFDNGYRLLVTADEAEAGNLSGIADLAGRENLRVAVPREYVRRPRDGLNALAERYGLRLARPVIIDAPAERYRALLEGRADVVVGYATDGAIADLDLAVLDDTLSFFPPYEGAVVVRQDTLARKKGLVDALKQLEGRIDTVTMRRLNAEVQIEGHAPATVAQRFLVANDLLTEEQMVDEKRPVLVLGVDGRDDLSGFVRNARTAIRAAFPDRPVNIQSVDDPVGAVANGAARVVVVGAERFFPRRRVQRSKLRRETRMEAIAPVGSRVLHLLRRGDDDRVGFGGKIGVPERRSGAGMVADAVLRLEKVSETLRASPAALVAALVDAQIDAALILAPAGDEAIEAGLKRGLRLQPLSEWLDSPRAAAIPYLRAARIPPGTYSGQSGPVETLGAQVLLAGPANRGALSSGGGPAAALPTGGTPLTRAEVVAVADNTGVPEAPDPALPSAWNIRPQMQVDEGLRFESVLDIVLNLLLGFYCVWLVRVVLSD